MFELNLAGQQDGDLEVRGPWFTFHPCSTGLESESCSLYPTADPGTFSGRPAINSTTASEETLPRVWDNHIGTLKVNVALKTVSIVNTSVSVESGKNNYSAKDGR